MSAKKKIDSTAPFNASASKALSGTNRAAKIMSTLPLAMLPLMPMSAQAFIDERTVQAQPGQQPAPGHPVTYPIPQPASTQAVTPYPSTLAPMSPYGAPSHGFAPEQAQPAARLIYPGFTGDMSHPAWSAAYPGPNGRMALSDALIAQIVPVLGTAIELDGSAEVFTRNVVVAEGLSRAQTIQKLATDYGLAIALVGNGVAVVDVAEANRMAVAQELAQTRQPVAGSIEPGRTQAGGLAHASHPLNLSFRDGVMHERIDPALQAAAKQAEPVMSWTIERGTMLSTSMLEWAKKWGWELIWKADVDYRISADIHLQDTFLGAVGDVLEAYSSSNRPLWGDWNDEQKVLVIHEPNARTSKVDDGGAR